jgi:hypothetical protein
VGNVRFSQRGLKLELKARPRVKITTVTAFELRKGFSPKRVAFAEILERASAFLQTPLAAQHFNTPRYLRDFPFSKQTPGVSAGFLKALRT